VEILFNFPWSLLQGKWVISGHDSWSKQLLALYLSLLASREGIVYLVTYQPIRIELIDELKDVVEKIGYNEDNIIVVHRRRLEKIDNARLIIFYEIPYTPKIDFSNIIIFTTPGSGVRKYRDWTRITLKKVDEKEYLLKTPEGYLRLTISTKYIGLSKPLTGIYLEALNLLRKSIVEYGSLTIRDAIEILAYNLGLKKHKARELLGYLVKKGYVKIENKELIVY